MQWFSSAFWVLTKCVKGRAGEKEFRKSEEKRAVKYR